MTPPELHVRRLRDAERGWLTRRLNDAWGSVQMVTRGRVHDASQLPALICEAGRERVGFATYELRGDQCELVTLDALREGRGVGSALLKAIVKEAQRRHARRVWLITTNDNLHAVGFYQRRGFKIAAVHPGAVETSRRLKPSIPLLAQNGIPIRDELELELELGREEDEGGRGPEEPRTALGDWGLGL